MKCHLAIMAIMAISALYSEACAVKVIEVFQIALKTLRNKKGTKCTCSDTKLNHVKSIRKNPLT